jgi:hypothetical protein
VSAEKKTDFHVVNHSLPRRDGRVKVTGKAQYVADLKLIGMAYAKVLRSPYAHAKIISIDKSRAEAHPGRLLRRHRLRSRGTQSLLRPCGERPSAAGDRQSSLCRRAGRRGRRDQ